MLFCSLIFLLNYLRTFCVCEDKSTQFFLIALWDYSLWKYLEFVYRYFIYFSLHYIKMLHCISVPASISIGYISRSSTATGSRGFNTLAFNNNAIRILSDAPRNGKQSAHYLTSSATLGFYQFFSYLLIK